MTRLQSILCSTRSFVDQCEKFLYNESYPFLLPKTYEDPEELRVSNWRDFLDGPPFKVNAQVSNDGIHRKIHLSLCSACARWARGPLEHERSNHRFRMPTSK